MDWFYLIIFGIALVVYFLDKMHIENTQENFSESDFPQKNLGVDFSAPSPEPSASMGITNIKLPGTPKWESRFKRFGPTPPQRRCNVTVLGENCSNYPYNDNTGKYQQICQTSYNTYPAGTQGFRAPLYVMGRSLSRVDQCNNLYDPANTMSNNNHSSLL